MARPSGEKCRCSGKWTEARYRSFIKSGLRVLTKKWEPIQETLRLSKVRHGVYKCAECKQEVSRTKTVDGVRVTNIIVDHVNPVVALDNIGYPSWDSVIERMFCERVDKDGNVNLQALCYDCHKEKCSEEAAIRTEVRRNAKQ